MILSKNKKIYDYIDEGTGEELVFLHGLMGGIGNFEKQIEYFSSIGYRTIMPELPIKQLSPLKCNLNGLTDYVKKFIDYLELKNFTFVGNSLGGHIAINYEKKFPNEQKRMVLTGSSGLYEKSFGETYPRRGDKEYLREKIKEVFYKQEVVTDELVDKIFDITRDRLQLIKIVSIAKNAIRTNMSEFIKTISIPVCIIWGKEDNVTPPDVAEEFKHLIEHSNLYWIRQCGHAPMMEHSEIFNNILDNWLSNNKVNID